MKIIFYLIKIFIILIFFSSCTVNDSTGLIRVENHTSIELKNVKIGNTLIASYVAPGNYVDYWYFITLKGKITTEGVEVNEFQEDIEFKLLTGYWVFITAQKYEYDDQVEISIKNQGENQDDEWQD